MSGGGEGEAEHRRGVCTPLAWLSSGHVYTVPPCASQQLRHSWDSARLLLAASSESCPW